MWEQQDPIWVASGSLGEGGTGDAEEDEGQALGQAHGPFASEGTEGRKATNLKWQTTPPQLWETHPPPETRGTSGPSS